MSVYTSIPSPLNKVTLGSAAEEIICGTPRIAETIAQSIHSQWERTTEPVVVALDGGLGIPYHSLAKDILAHLPGLTTTVLDVRQALKPLDVLKALIQPSLPHSGNWGRVFKGQLRDFFDPALLADIQAQLQHPAAEVTLCIGPGAALSGLLESCHLVLYADQTRESLYNAYEHEPLPFFGAPPDQDPRDNLERYCYVEGPVLDAHKRQVLSLISGYLAWNPPQEALYLPRRSYEALVGRLAVSPMFFKTLYSPTAWGGNWLKELLGLPQEMRNSGQGWIIPVESSLLVDWGGACLLDLPFLNVLWHAPVPLLGQAAARLSGGQMPLNYYYNDQIGGGHMSIQVHPHDAYMQTHFNEPMRQDESYYILHSAPGARSFLGLQPQASLAELRREAEVSAASGQPFDFEHLIQSVESQPGDFLMIPAGTLHASGAEQVVLEINWSLSAYTPGYTFRLYDYASADATGKPRQLHIERTFAVLQDRRRQGLASFRQAPEMMRQGPGWREVCIGRRSDMLFAVSRLEFDQQIGDRTEPEDSFHVLSLVEGRQIEVLPTGSSYGITVDYPNTVLLPASLGGYRLRSTDGQPCKVVKVVVVG